jgi:glycosidase
MEVGDSTESTDPALFEKIPVFWSPEGRPPLRSIYRDLIKLRKSNPAFFDGELDWAENSSADQVVTLLRRDSKDEFLVLVNLSNRPINGSVELTDANGFAPVTVSCMPGPVGIQLPAFRLSGYGWFIYHRAIPK